MIHTRFIKIIFVLFLVLVGVLYFEGIFGKKDVLTTNLDTSSGDSKVEYSVLPSNSKYTLSKEEVSSNTSSVVSPKDTNTSGDSISPINHTSNSTPNTESAKLSTTSDSKSIVQEKTTPDTLPQNTKNTADVSISTPNINPTLLNTKPTEKEVLLATALCKPTSSSVSKKVYGISDPRLGEAGVEKAVIDTNTKWVRTGFRWEWISPSSGTFYPSDSDKKVGFFRDNNIKILGTVDYPPAYINDWKVFGKEYAIYFGTLMNRYKPNGSFAKEAGYTGGYGISYWEIFNEPNSPGFGWFDGRANAVYKGSDFLYPYVYTLAVSNVVARKVDPNAVLVLGGLSPDGYPAFDYLKELYRLGAKDCFDVIAYHPYAYENKFSEAYSKLKAVAGSYGDSNKSIWFDEYGTTDNSRRAIMLGEVIKEKNIPDGIFWYTFIDYFNNSEGSWGVMDMSYKKKPEYDLLKTLLN